MDYDNDYGDFDASTCDECEFLRSECVCECMECECTRDECECKDGFC